jgi:uncharacterized OB-fold protein
MRRTPKRGGRLLHRVRQQHPIGSKSGFDNFLKRDIPMLQELICQKCGSTFMGDPWVDEYCENCRQSPSGGQKNIENPKRDVAEDLNVEAVPISRSASQKGNEDGSHVHKRRRPGVVQKQHQNKAGTPNNAEIHDDINKDAFTWLKSNLISVDSTGLNSLLKDKIFLIFCSSLILILLVRYGMPRLDAIATKEMTLLCMFGFYTLWVVMFDYILLRNIKLILLSVLGVASTFFFGGLFRRIWATLVGDFFQSSLSIDIILGLREFLFWNLFCAAYLLYNHKIRNKSINISEAIAICVSSSLVDPFFRIGRFISRAYEMDLSYTRLALLSFSECFLVSSLAVMSASFILMALTHHKRRGESLFVAMLPPALHAWLFVSANLFLFSVLSIGSLILLFGYLSKWGIYPLKLKSSYVVTTTDKKIPEQPHIRKGDFCPKCGSATSPTAKFCPKCGNKLQ